jgi:hypothetical protein
VIHVGRLDAVAEIETDSAPGMRFEICGAGSGPATAVAVTATGHHAAGGTCSNRMITSPLVASPSTT